MGTSSMMSMSRAPGYRSVLNKYNPGGPCVNTAGWHLKSLTEAYETSEDNRMLRTKLHWLCCLLSLPNGLTSWE